MCSYTYTCILKPQYRSYYSTFEAKVPALYKLLILQTTARRPQPPSYWGPALPNGCHGPNTNHKFQVRYNVVTQISDTHPNMHAYTAIIIIIYVKQMHATPSCIIVCALEALRPKLTLRA